MRPFGLQSPAYNLLSVFCLLVLLSGCDKRAVEKAEQEAREAKTSVQQLKHNLAMTEKALVEAKAELAALKQDRDELQNQVKQASEERDQAMELAQKAQEAAMVRSGGQASETASLQKQVAELTALVAKQQEIIEQLKGGEAGESTPAPDETTPTEPNEG
jgi:chromosome segregation ATPase